MSWLAPHLQGVLLAWGAFVLATLSPGPAMLATMGTASSSGRRAGLAFGWGVTCGSATWGILAALGLSTLLSLWAGALDVIRLLGAAYLTYLAARAYRDAFRTRRLELAAAPRRSLAAQFLRGWGLHLTNPKAIVAWLAIIALGLGPEAPAQVAALVISGAVLFALTFYSLLALLFSTPAVVCAYARARRAIDAALGTFFLYAAARLAFR